MVRTTHLLVTLTLAFASAQAFAEGNKEKTVGGKVKEAAQDTVKVAKKMGRRAKDEVCEMVNGQLECAAKRAANRMKDAADEVKDKAND